MSYHKKSYVEHAVVIVKDIHWHIRFFKEALIKPVLVEKIIKRSLRSFEA